MMVVNMNFNKCGKMSFLQPDSMRVMTLTLFQRSFIISRSARMCCLSVSVVMPAAMMRRPLELTFNRWL